MGKGRNEDGKGYILHPVVRVYTDRAIGSGTLLYSKKSKGEDEEDKK